MLSINDVVHNIFEKDLNIKNIDKIDQSEHGVTNQTYFHTIHYFLNYYKILISAIFYY